MTGQNSQLDLFEGLGKNSQHPTDQPSIGLILCKTKQQLVVEYALRNTTTPMGIAEFTNLEALPAELRGSLPTIEELEAELDASYQPENL